MSAKPNWLDAEIAALFEVEDRRTVTEWAEQEINLSIRQTETPGPYSALLTPYVREILDSVADPRISSITLCWGSQTSKTNTMMIVACWRVINRPAPTMWVAPSKEFVEAFALERWEPMVTDCKPMMARLNTDTRTRVSQLFGETQFNFVGSNSPAALASRPVGLIIMDELDKFSWKGTGEASAMRLAEQRLKTYTNPLSIKTSTPTDEEGTIWQEFLRGDQRYYMMPCPVCGKPLRFEWENVRWAETAKDAKGNWDRATVKSTAHYQCPHCQAQIHDGHKTRMLRAGKWVATNPNAPPGVRSYHLNSMYAPWLSCSFGELAMRWLDSQASRDQLQDFFNGWLALPWQEYVAGVGQDQVMSLRGDYRLRTVPFPVDEIAYFTLCADPGQATTHYAVACVSKKGEVRVVDYGTCLAIEDLGRIAAGWECGGHRIQLGLVDSGDFTERVYRFCASSGGLFWPSKGSKASFGTWNQSQLKEWNDLILYSYVDFSAKCSLYIDKIAKKLPPFLALPNDVGTDFMAGLIGQRLVEQRSKMGVTRFWKPLPNDHYGDCTKLVMITWWVMGGHFGGVGVTPDA